MSSTDEKKPRRGLFSNKSSPDSVKDADDSTEKKSAEHDAVETAPAAKPEVPPVGFTKLFRWVSYSSCASRMLRSTLLLSRFSTKTELFLNFIGLICACGAGAAQASLVSPLVAPQS